MELEVIKCIKTDGFELSLNDEKYYTSDYWNLKIIGKISKEGVDFFLTFIENIQKEKEMSILLDLEKMDYISSKGMEALFKIQNDLQKKGHLLILSNKPKWFKELLNVISMANFIEKE